MQNSCLLLLVSMTMTVKGSHKGKTVSFWTLSKTYLTPPLLSCMIVLLQQFEAYCGIWHIYIYIASCSNDANKYIFSPNYFVHYQKVFHTKNIFTPKLFYSPQNLPKTCTDKNHLFNSKQKYLFTKKTFYISKKIFLTT